MDIEYLANEVHRIAVSKEWWEEYNYAIPIESITLCLSLTAKIMLIVSECSEAVECLRRNEIDMRIESDKPEGFIVELVDVLIRTLDLLEALRLYHGIDFMPVLIAKKEYNKTREIRHGGKRI